VDWFYRMAWCIRAFGRRMHRKSGVCVSTLSLPCFGCILLWIEGWSDFESSLYVQLVIFVANHLSYVATESITCSSSTYIHRSIRSCCRRLDSAKPGAAHYRKKGLSYASLSTHPEWSWGHDTSGPVTRTTATRFEMGYSCQHSFGLRERK